MKDHEIREFAIIFESKKYNQILIFKDTDESGCPAIKITAVPRTMGNCTVTAGFADTDEGWLARDDNFNTLTLEKAEYQASKVYDVLNDVA